MRGKPILSLALLSLLIAAGAAHADEIRLKDGTKIIGTIVGFENDSFRVETSYGFALVQKDKVADINIVAHEKGLRAQSQVERVRHAACRRARERSPSGRERIFCAIQRFAGSECVCADAPRLARPRGLPQRLRSPHPK